MTKAEKEIKEEYRSIVVKAAARYIAKTIRNVPKNFKMLMAAAKANHYPRWFLCVDFALSAILFGDCVQEYLCESKFRFNLVEKRRFYSRRREFLMCYLYTRTASSKVRINLDSKNRFCCTYARFLHRETLFVPEHTDTEILDFLQRHGKLIAKPCDTYGGKGVHLVEAGELTPQELKRLRDEKYLLEELVIQHPKMAAINPSSVNTIRVTTILDAEGGFHVENTFLRAGYPGSVVDNLSVGGVAYPVDTETGIVVGRGNTDECRGLFLRHPGSGTVMPGFQIPMWQEVLQMCEQVARVQPELRRLGWDVAITEDGPVLIEGNSVTALLEMGGAQYYEVWKYLRSKKSRKNSRKHTS